MRFATRVAAVAVPVLFLAGAQTIPAAAAGGVTARPSGAPKIDIVKETARFINDEQVNVVIHVWCTGGSGTSLVTADVTQSASQSGNGTSGSGSGYETVNCDGRWHNLAIVVSTQFPIPNPPPAAGAYFNLGPATATVNFYSQQTTYPPSGSPTLTDGPETIHIRP